MATVGARPGLTRLLDHEPDERERYAHTEALLALIARQQPTATRRAAAGSLARSEGEADAGP